MGKALGKRPFLTPRCSLYRELWPRLEAQAVEVVIGHWIRVTLHVAPDEPLPLGGKTLHGAKKREQAAPIYYRSDASEPGAPFRGAGQRENEKGTGFEYP